MWTDGNGSFYVGDCRVGDRAATPAEIAAWEAARTPTQDQLIAATLTKARQMRLDIFKVLDGLQVSALVNADTTLAQQIEASKQALRDLPQQINLTVFTTAKHMEDAVQAAYFGIVAQAPASIRSAFAALVPR
jgi:hypothetical protein